MGGAYIWGGLYSEVYGIYINMYIYIYTSTGNQSLHKEITLANLAGLTRVTNIFSRPQKKI